jgi:hypothetical protein
MAVGASPYDVPSRSVSSIGSSAPQRWKTGRQRATKPHMYDDIFKEKWGHLQGKLTVERQRTNGPGMEGHTHAHAQQGAEPGKHAFGRLMTR